MFLVKLFSQLLKLFQFGLVELLSLLHNKKSCAASMMGYKNKNIEADTQSGKWLQMFENVHPHNPQLCQIT